MLAQACEGTCWLACHARTGSPSTVDVALQDESSTESEVTGRLESLRSPGEVPAFSPIVVSASTGAISSQVMWFQLEMLTEAVLCFIQAACIITQVWTSGPR